jgi:hypothetical protein
MSLEITGSGGKGTIRLAMVWIQHTVLEQVCGQSISAIYQVKDALYIIHGSEKLFVNGNINLGKRNI